MTPETFQAMQPLLDKIAELVSAHLDSEELRGVMSEFGKLIGDGKSASVHIVVDVFDEERVCSLPLLTTGLTTFPGKVRC